MNKGLVQVAQHTIGTQLWYTYHQYQHRKSLLVLKVVICFKVKFLSLMMFCGWYQILLLGPLHPDASILKPANDRHPQSTQANSLSSDHKVYNVLWNKDELDVKIYH